MITDRVFVIERIYIGDDSSGVESGTCVHKGTSTTVSETMSKEEKGEMSVESFETSVLPRLRSPPENPTARGLRPLFPAHRVQRESPGLLHPSRFP
jgi:hypothetical protein